MRGLLYGAIAAVALGTASRAADQSAMPLKAPKASAAYDWTGAYVGGHAGWGVGTVGVGANAAPGEILAVPNVPLSGMLAGFQAGYNWQLANRLVLGVEADVTFVDYFGNRLAGELVEGRTSTIQANLHNFGTLRGRVGYAFGRILPYVTAGVAWGHNKIDVNYENELAPTKTLMQLGWTIGAGIDYAFDDRWSLRAEYGYVDLGARTYDSVFLDQEAMPGLRISPRIHALKLGLNYRLTPPGGSKADGADATPDWSDWSIHGQSTFIEQGYPSFNSPYEGPHSLSGASQARNTITATAFVGRRLWEGAEFYFNPEIDQGFGLSDTLGLGGFSNGEAQKSNYPVPHPNIARLFLRQTFGFVGEQEKVEDGPNQIAGKRDVSRLTFTVGKVAVTDFFDDNAYSHDPRATFMNWSLWEAGAFDYPADTIGLTWGAVAELNQKDWALRAGYFLVPVVSNVNPLDLHIPERGGYLVELETRYSVFSQPGKLRLIGWLTRANAGSYSETLDNPLFGVDITQTRRTREKYGLVANLEQAITADLGVFSRLSWNNGKTEIMSFTDIDASGSLGAVLKGTAWHRPDDKIGLAGAINGLSADHRDFIAAGGLGPLIGDGRLNYREERILEAYYAIGLTKWATLTLDYQFVANPAYNADRGPVSIFSTRLHAEF